MGDQFDFDFDAPETSEDLLAYARQQFERLCREHPMKRRPTLIWKPLRVSAGKAYFAQHAISLSSIVLTTRQRVLDTLIHEYAHLLAFDRHGRKAANHGPYWQQAMADLGAKPEVTHNYTDAIVRNQRRSVAVHVCRKCGARFELARRLPRRRKHLHRGCGGLVAYVHHATPHRD
ncbi:MAG: SprT-like domain-containing protein [Nitrospirae bacterium]|nr:SprT-like domain-containing protein [Fimbriimonadaceae bacterium]